jgi:hypothetical protein
MYIKKILKFLLRIISKLGCYCNFPFLTFSVLSLFLKKILKKNIRSNKNILILPKSGGREDIYASYTDEINNCIVYEMPRAEMKNVYNCFVTSKKVKNYRYFHDETKIIEQKNNYFNFLRKILFYFKKFYKINLIINFNFTYKEEIELARASLSQNIKFLTIQKESQSSAGKRQVNELVYKNSIKKYPGSLIAVYNQDEKNNIINSGIIDKDKIKVIGSPRVDFSFNIVKEKHFLDKICLVYYCIQSGVSLPIYEGEFRTEGVHKVDEFNWIKLAEKTEHFLVDYKKKNSSKIKMIFKTKTGFVDQVDRLKKIDTSGVQIVYNNTGHHLLKEADVVVAFNSTTIFESMAANIPVIIPDFNLNEIQKKFAFDLHNVENIYYVKSYLDLENSLEIIRSNRLKIKKPITQNQKDILNKYVGNSDGKSGYRLRNLIKEINV